MGQKASMLRRRRIAFKRFENAQDSDINNEDITKPDCDPIESGSNETLNVADTQTSVESLKKNEKTSQDTTEHNCCTSKAEPSRGNAEEEPRNDEQNVWNKDISDELLDKIFNLNFINNSIRDWAFLKEELVQHSDLLEREKVHYHECPLCREQYRKIDSLKEHMKLHDPECIYCKRQFPVKDFDAHMRTHRHKCPLCKKQLTTYESLKEHVKLHDPECIYCKRLFPVNDLKAHMRTHYHECPICKEWFTDTDVLNLHVTLHSNASRTYECRNCKKWCKTFGELVEHWNIKL